MRGSTSSSSGRGPSSAARPRLPTGSMAAAAAAAAAGTSLPPSRSAPLRRGRSRSRPRLRGGTPPSAPPNPPPRLFVYSHRKEEPSAKLRAFLFFFLAVVLTAGQIECTPLQCVKPKRVVSGWGETPMRPCVAFFLTPSSPPPSSSFLFFRLCRGLVCLWGRKRERKGGDKHNKGAFNDLENSSENQISIVRQLGKQPTGYIPTGCSSKEHAKDTSFCCR